MNKHCAKFYTNTRTNMDIIYDNAVHFCHFCMKFEYFLNILPQKYNLGHIKPDIIINIFCKVMEYPCA